jgi:hypothetical protein
MQQLFSVSLADIENDLVDYFATRFGTNPSNLPPATNVKQMYNFSPAAWAQLADTLSMLPWMVHLGVVLAESEMGSVSTLAQLAALIQKQIKHVVASTADLQVSPLAPLMKLSRQAQQTPAQPSPPPADASPTQTPKRPRGQRA